MSKYCFIQVNTFNCSECDNKIEEDYYYAYDGICIKCNVLKAFNDSLEGIATDNGQSTLDEKLADFLLTIDKRGLDEILADSSDDQVITKLWDILNLFNPNGTDNDPTFTSDEWDEICIQMAWITEDFNK